MNRSLCEYSRIPVSLSPIHALGEGMRHRSRRVCRCCGQEFARDGWHLFGNPNVCAYCLIMEDELEDSQLAGSPECVTAERDSGKQATLVPPLDATRSEIMMQSSAEPFPLTSR